MKNILTFIIFLFIIGISAQDLAKINSDLKLSDSLTYKTEVRIYQSGGITNYYSVFRMFQDKSDNWIAEFYQHYDKVDGSSELRTEKQILEPENDMEFIFQNLIRSHILDLPNLSEIRWKLVTQGNVEKAQKKHNGKIVEVYESSSTQIAILDGEGFNVQVKGWNGNNEFYYSNPDSYLKYYPEIDELIYICEILNLIRVEFQIWKK